jgi:hypothetical protein
VVKLAEQCIGKTGQGRRGFLGFHFPNDMPYSVFCVSLSHLFAEGRRSDSETCPRGAGWWEDIRQCRSRSKDRHGRRRDTTETAEGSCVKTWREGVLSTLAIMASYSFSMPLQMSFVSLPRMEKKVSRMFIMR